MTIKELKTLTYGSVFRFPESDFNNVILGICKDACAIAYIKIEKTIKITEQTIIEAMQKRDVVTCSVFDLLCIDFKLIKYEPFTFLITKLHLMHWSYFDYSIFNVGRPLVEEFCFCTEYNDLKPLHMYVDLTDVSVSRHCYYVYDGKASIYNKLVDLTNEPFLLRDIGLISPRVYHRDLDVGAYVTINSFPYLIIDKKHMKYIVVPCKTTRIDYITDYFGEKKIVKKSSFDKINYINGGYDQVTMKLVRKYEEQLRDVLLQRK